MTRFTELKLMATHAIGFTDVSVAPDIILDLIAENELLAESASSERDRVTSIIGQYAHIEDERGQLKAEIEALRTALGNLLLLYIDDEGCQLLPEYIAGRAAMGNGEQP